MDTTISQVPTIPGTAFAGGFYAGRLLVAGETFALIVAPKAEGERDEVPLNKSTANVVGALSFFDGHANTAALAEAGSELATWACALRIDDFDDWYIPSRDELEICYRALKPTAEENYCYRGDNPSSVPVGYAYSLEVPAQTSAEAFKEDGAEAFTDSWYWSSTQYAGGEASAWCQDFYDGGQYDVHKAGEFRVRAVRRLKI